MPTTTNHYETESEEVESDGFLGREPVSTYARWLTLLVAVVTAAVFGVPAAGMVATALIPVLVLVALLDSSEGSPYSVIERVHYGG